MFTPETLSLAERVVAQARAQRIRIATAESCTGGLITAALTEIAGSSDVVECGFVVYSDEAKSRLLGVPEEILRNAGAVSQDAARAMANGALKNSRASLSVAVTGIAGPTGGSTLKPVGLVHMAAARTGRGTEHRKCEYGDVGRTEVRLATVDAALKLLLRML